MNILYIAYSCSPNHGSEDRIGWKIPVANSARNNVTVITKKEHETQINEYINENNINIKFYYVDIPKIYKKLCKGALYAGRLNVWQKKALALAEQICKKEKIDVIHQITPVEFRSIGDYGKIPNTKFVCGPVGGGEYIPNGLRRYATKQAHLELFRWFANRWSLLKMNFNGVLRRCDALLFANKETQDYLSPIVGDKNSVFSACVSEIGIDDCEIIKQPENAEAKEQKRIFLVSGRLAYRKGHALLLKAFSELGKELDYECLIAGNGKEYKRLKKKAEKYCLNDKIHFLGRVPFEEMEKTYQKAHVLIMPSLRETTGSVLLEAMARGLPVITVNKFGGAVLLDKSNAWLYGGKNHEEYVEGLKKAVTDCITDGEALSCKSASALSSAQKNTWEQKVSFYNSVYKKVLK